MDTMTPVRWLALSIATVAWLLMGVLLMGDFQAGGISCGSVVSPDRPIDPTESSFGGSIFAEDPNIALTLTDSYEAAIDRCDEQRLTRVLWMIVILMLGVGASVMAVKRWETTSRRPPPPGWSPPPPDGTQPVATAASTTADGSLVGPPTYAAPADAAPSPPPPSVWAPPPATSQPLFPGSPDNPYGGPSAT